MLIRTSVVQTVVGRTKLGSSYSYFEEVDKEGIEMRDITRSANKNQKHAHTDTHPNICLWGMPAGGNIDEWTASSVQRPASTNSSIVLVR